jgi:hypothetical protein
MDSSMQLNDNDGMGFVIDTLNTQILLDDGDTKDDFAAQLIMVLNTPAPLLCDCSILLWLGLLPLTCCGTTSFGPIPPPDSTITDLAERLQTLTNLVRQMKYKTEVTTGKPSLPSRLSMAKPWNPLTLFTSPSMMSRL